MKFGGIGWLELVIILVVVLLIFGPKNLPKLGNAIGKTVSNLRAGMSEGKKKKKDEADNVVKSQDESGASEEPAVRAQLEEVVEEAPDGTVTETVEETETQEKPPTKVRRVVKKVPKEEPVAK